MYDDLIFQRGLAEVVSTTYGVGIFSLILTVEIFNKKIKGFDGPWKNLELDKIQNTKKSSATFR
jgi:hypothetical protein